MSAVLKIMSIISAAAFGVAALGAASGGPSAFLAFIAAAAGSWLVFQWMASVLSGINAAVELLSTANQRLGGNTG